MYMYIVTTDILWHFISSILVHHFYQASILLTLQIVAWILEVKTHTTIFVLSKEISECANVSNVLEVYTVATVFQSYIGGQLT